MKTIFLLSALTCEVVYIQVCNTSVPVVPGKDPFVGVLYQISTSFDGFVSQNFLLTSICKDWTAAHEFTGFIRREFCRKIN